MRPSASSLMAYSLIKALEQRLFFGDMFQTVLGNAVEPFVFFYTYIYSIESFSGNGGSSGAKERIENCIALLGCEPDDTFKYLGRLLRRMLLLGYNPTMEHAVIKLVLVKIVQCRSLLVYADDELNVL